jgi:hypothetical protein
MQHVLLRQERGVGQIGVNVAKRADGGREGLPRFERCSVGEEGNALDYAVVAVEDEEVARVALDDPGKGNRGLEICERRL